jgi:hypothetical protein
MVTSKRYLSLTHLMWKIDVEEHSTQHECTTTTMRGGSTSKKRLCTLLRFVLRDFCHAALRGRAVPRHCWSPWANIFRPRYENFGPAWPGGVITKFQAMTINSWKKYPKFKLWWVCCYIHVYYTLFKFISLNHVYSSIRSCTHLSPFIS